METGSLIPVLSAIVAGIVTVVTALITARVQLAIAKVQVLSKLDNPPNHPADPSPITPLTAGAVANTTPKRQWSIAVMLKSCGIILLVWGIF